MDEMRARVDPRLALLPDGLQTVIRSSGYYNEVGYSAEPRVHMCEHLATACETLAVMDVTSSVEIIGALAHAQPEVREAARKVVGMLRWRRTVPLLLRQFEQMSEERESIGDTLAKLDSRRARAQRVKWMITSPDPRLRWHAAYSLCNDTHPSLASPFLFVVKNEGEKDDTRKLAMEALAYILSLEDRRSRLWRTSTQALLPYLSHPDWSYRWEAAFALGQAGARKALPRLREMAQNDDEVKQGCWSLVEIISWIEQR